MHEPWQLVRLSDVARVSHGWAFPSSACRSPRGGAPRLIRIGDFARTSRSHFLPERVQEYVGDYPDRFALEPGDLLMAMTCQSADGEILGVTMRVPDNGERYLHNQRLGRIQILDETRVDSKFLELSFAMPAFNQHLFTSASGSKILHTSPGRILDYEMLLPPLEEQRRIAGVLGALDDLAGTCEKLSQALMTLTRLLFRQRVTANPAVVRLGDVLEFRYGKSLPAHARTEGAVPVVSSAGVVGTHSEALVAGPGVVVGRKGSVGTVHWVPTDFFPIDTAFFVETELPTLVAFFALESAGLEKLNTDSAVPGLNRANALAQQVSLMTTDEIPVFAAQVVELWQAAEQLNAEAAQARTTRDELLPLLLSGRVRVGEVAA